MRKDILEYVRQEKGKGIKINYAKVARQYGCDYRTVKKYYENDYKPKERKQRESKLDGYKEIICEKLDNQCNYYSIYEYLKKKGYDGKYSILAAYCKSHVDEEKKKATVRFETNPGLQAQVDWKEEMTLHTRNGEAVTFNIYLMVLGYSRYKYLELTLDRSQDTLKSAMIRAFQEFGGVPREILFDNMRTVVDQSRTKYKQAVINDKFYQFSRDIGFEVLTCRAYRPQTKGKVEALARTMERLRPYDYEFDTIEELAEIVKEVNWELNQEISKATWKVPADLLKKEKEYFRPLPSKDVIETYLTTPIRRKVSKESMVAYKNQKYSLPVYYIGKTVELQEDDKKLSILFSGRIINTFEITDKRYNYTKEDMVEILRSDAMKHRNAGEIEEVAKKNLQIYDSLGG